MAFGKRAGVDEAIVERRQKVFELRKKGLSLRKIVETLTQQGVATNRETARKDLKYEMARIAREMESDVKAVRALELERYDHLQELLSEKLTGVDENGLPCVNLAVVDRLLRLQKQRAELLGMNAPVTQEINLRNISSLTDEQLAALAEGKMP